MFMVFSRRPLTLRLADFVTPPQCFLVARTHISPKYGPNLHRHDFAEFFWITDGVCEHRFQGGSETLGPGDIRFVRPEHSHEFSSLDAGGARLTNIALPADFIKAWEESYPLLAGQFFWSASGRPEGHRPTMEAATHLDQAASELAGDTANLLVLHHFMMHLFLDALDKRHYAQHLPFWLKHGMERLPRVFTDGVSGFVRACGRSPEHVSRATRKHLDKTPGDLVNRARMDYAAQQLRMTDDNILNIMMDCGLTNPSHFYALFRKHYGQTPRQYRLRRHGVLGHALE